MSVNHEYIPMGFETALSIIDNDYKEIMNTSLWDLKQFIFGFGFWQLKIMNTSLWDLKPG